MQTAVAAGPYSRCLHIGHAYPPHLLVHGKFGDFAVLTETFEPPIIALQLYVYVMGIGRHS